MRRPISSLTVLLALLSLFAAPAVLAAPAKFDGATVQMTRLPTWVQVTDPVAPLYTTDTSTSTVAARFARFTFLRVLGGGASRLHVDAYDDAGNQGARGWVDPSDVLPSAPGTDWLVSVRPTSLLKAVDGAQVIRTIDRFAPLQQVDGPVQDRVEVYVYQADFTLLDHGWVDVADSAPAYSPQARVQSPTPDRTLAAGPNYFGIKATSSLGNDGLVWLPTSEYDAAGQTYDIISPFRAYKSLLDSMTDHDQLLLTGRYAVAMRVANDPRQFAEQLYEAGYSTDPTYADKLIALMDRYDLYRLDA